MVLPVGDPGRQRSAHPRAQGLVPHARGKATRGCRCARPALLAFPCSRPCQPGVGGCESGAATVARLLRAPAPARTWAGRRWGAEGRTPARPALWPRGGSGGNKTFPARGLGDGRGGERRAEQSPAAPLAGRGALLPPGAGEPIRPPHPLCSARLRDPMTQRSRAEGDREGAGCLPCRPGPRPGPRPGWLPPCKLISPTQTPSSPRRPSVCIMDWQEKGTETRGEGSGRERPPGPPLHSPKPQGTWGLGGGPSFGPKPP